MGAPEDSTRIPRLTEGTDIRSLSIDPFEGFMVSRIDGTLTAQDVADSTGADVSQVVALVDKLLGLGVASWLSDSESPTPPSEERKPEQRKPDQRKVVLTGSAPVTHGPRVYTRPPPRGTSLGLYDPAELDEAADLPDERKREILDRYYRLEELNYYELLSIPRSAEKKDIRGAYFALSKVFHPDTLFGKELGSYKHKMERVFGALTKAYEVLGKKRARKDYDFYLGLTDDTKAAEQGLADTEVDAKAAEKAALEAASAEPLGSEPPAQSAPSSSTPPRSTPSPSSSSTPPRSTPRPSVSSTPPRSTPSPSSSSTPPRSTPRPSVSSTPPRST
ncbi:MAG: hypothetical protein ACI9KE_003351, partial [Polyangiales bacterium]